MAKRAKPMLRGITKGRRERTANTGTAAKRTQSPRVLSSESANNVGRPGFKGKVPGPTDGKLSVRRVRQIDPARGITQPGADVITTTHVDLVGTQNPSILSQAAQAVANAGKRVIRPPRQSPPVRSNRPGKVTRPGRQ